MGLYSIAERLEVRWEGAAGLGQRTQGEELESKRVEVQLSSRYLQVVEGFEMELKRKLQCDYLQMRIKSMTHESTECLRNKHATFTISWPCWGWWSRGDLHPSHLVSDLLHCGWRAILLGIGGLWS